MPQQVLIVLSHRALAEALGQSVRGLGSAEVRAVSSYAEAVRLLGDGDGNGDEATPPGEAVSPRTVVMHVGPGQQEAVRAMASVPGVRVVALVDEPDAAPADAGASGGGRGAAVLRDAGAHAVLGGEASLAELLAALYGGGAAGAAPGPPVRLSPREREVLALKGDGYSTAAVAARLGLSVHTVRDHLKRILGKLGAHSQLEAVIVASRLGLLNVTD